MKSFGQFLAVLALMIFFLGVLIPLSALLFEWILVFLFRQGWWAFAWMTGMSLLLFLLANLFTYGDEV